MISNLSLSRHVKAIKKGIEPLYVRGGASLKERCCCIYHSKPWVQAAFVYAAISLPSISYAGPAILPEARNTLVGRISQRALALPVEFKLSRVRAAVFSIKEVPLPLNLHHKAMERIVAATQALPVQGKPVRDVRKPQREDSAKARRHRCNQYLNGVSWALIHIAFSMVGFTVGYAIMYILISKGIVK